MNITIECECGNKVAVNVNSKKYAQFRDELDKRMFYYDGVGGKNEKCEEIRISCGKCGSWIVLGMD